MNYEAAPVTSNPNIGIIGCGYWGKNLVRNFHDLGALRTICDTNPALLEGQADLYPELHKTNDLAEVWKCESLKGVVLATPAASHYAHVKAALLAGKDVYVEKPLALSFRQGLELVELAEQKKAILMVGHILEYHPAITALRKAVEDGELGELRILHSSRLSLGKVRREENVWWSFAPHDIAVICRLVNDTPTTVCVHAATYLQNGICDSAHAQLTFAGGQEAHIHVTWLHPFKEQKLVLVGSKRMAVFDDVTREGKLKLLDKGIEESSAGLVPLVGEEKLFALPDAEPLRLECAHFVECILTRRTPLTDGKSALQVLKVLQAGQISMERGLSVSVNGIS